ncbi:hypothetical protein P280DRAFT_545967 [Massarina eburnea CBS 473.64]|uniref:Structure-specific endonuclease subunit SLX4 n=1 Tax=Massarina eburnea CBS 473.64 TaxID=1395130 RepID=A0A6A6SAC1_9PLEO|nr:hypothetical protein P280DRAFT_545967 [Massarina eburnea CBS 473.64]
MAALAVPGGDGGRHCWESKERLESNRIGNAKVEEHSARENSEEEIVNISSKKYLGEQQTSSHYTSDQPPATGPCSSPASPPCPPHNARHHSPINQRVTLINININININPRPTTQAIYHTAHYFVPAFAQYTIALIRRFGALLRNATMTQPFDILVLSSSPPVPIPDVPQHTAAKKARAPRKPRDSANSSTSSHFANVGEPAVEPPKAKVTKPRKPRAKKAVVSAHFAKAAKAVQAEEEDAGRGKPLDLDEAMSRRREWTPPTTELEDEARKEKAQAAVGVDKGCFTSLISGYAYPHAQVESTSAPTTTTSIATTATSIATKRHKSSPEKAKKKKARTITDLVTDQYAPKPPNPEPTVTSDFFQPRPTTATTKVPLNDTTNTTAAKKPRKRAPSKSPSESTTAGDAIPKPKSKKASAKAKSSAKTKVLADKLLSPASAVLRMNRQEVLFGTSSQLALDESPTMVRQIQEAMAESERQAEFELPLTEDAGLERKLWPRLGKIEGERALWKASARDEGGELLERQDIYMPEPDRTPPIITLSSDPPTPPRIVSAKASVTADEAMVDDISFIHIDDSPRHLQPSTQNVDSSLVEIDNFPTSAQLPVLSSPPSPAPLPTPAEPTTGSPTKRRGRPPKSQSVVPSVSASAPAPAAAKVTTKVAETNSAPKPPSTAKPAPNTPSSSSKRRFFGIEEILDSEDDEALSPTPPRARRLEKSPPLPLTTSRTATTTTCAAAPPPSRPSKKAKPKSVATAKSASTSKPSRAKKEAEDLIPVYKIPLSHLQLDAIKLDLFSKVTAAIRALPPTTNPASPSWHEKILMYDAIVLEDFTAYLNNLPGLNTWKKATQKQAKAWNTHLEAAGKTVLEASTDNADDGEEWDKENGEASGEVLAVENELEIWMVQKCHNRNHNHNHNHNPSTSTSTSTTMVPRPIQDIGMDIVELVTEAGRLVDMIPGQAPEARDGLRALLGGLYADIFELMRQWDVAISALEAREAAERREQEQERESRR